MHWPEDKTEIYTSFSENGYVVLEGFCDAESISDLLQHLQRYIDEYVPHLPPMDVFFEDSSSKDGIRMLSRMERHDPYFRDLLLTSPFHKVAEYLNGGPVASRDIAFFNKLPHIGEITPPHQDGYYFKLQPCKALTLWLALDDVDEDNGCIRYVSGSHRQGMRNHGRTNVLGFSQGISDYGSSDDIAKERAICVSAGDLIVHDALTIHRADENRSARTRRAFGFVYFDADASVDHGAAGRYQQELARDWKAEGRI